MLASFRRHLNSWYARLFFLLLVGTFVLWGVGDVFRNLGDNGSLGSVAGQKIDLAQVQLAYRQQLAQVAQMFGGKVDPTPQMKRGIAGQALEQVITQAALNAAVHGMGIGVSEDALRQAIAEIPAFHGANGQFDLTQYQTVLRNNNLTEPMLLDLVRADLGQRQVMEAARAGIVSPDVLTRAVFQFQEEKRVADAVVLPFSAAPAPPPATDQQLTRWYENNKDRYSTPEYRRIKAVILSPQSLAKDIQITDADLQGDYQQHIAEYQQPEKRSVQVLLAPDEDHARAIATLWSGGADWATVQKDNGPVELNDATEKEFPSPELGRAVFAAPLDQVSAPVKSPFGWQVFKVTKITPGSSRSLDEVRDQVRARVLAEKAADLIYDRAGKVQDALAAGSSLDDLPGDLGLAAIAGTLNAQGNTADGKPAPIPGSDELRSAMVQAAFAMKQGDTPHLTEGPKDDPDGQAYFAVTVESITPPAPKPFDEVKDAVRADWTRDAIRHVQEEAAAKILAAVKGGQTLAAAAGTLPVVALPATDRSSGAPGVPTQLIEPLFSLKLGEPTMIETSDGFTVATLADIQEADPNANPIGYGQVRDGLAKAIGDDVQSVLSVALRTRENPKVSPQAVDMVLQAQQPTP